MGISINPAVLEWAIDRSGKARNDIEKGINLTAWLNQEEEPSLRDLEKLAKKTYAPIGFLCSKIVPNEPLPIRDFRLLPNKSQAKPKGNLLDLIYECQRRQSWYKWYRESEGLGKVDVVGKYNIKQNPLMAAREIIRDFSFPHQPQDFSEYVKLIEEQDILVMSSSVVEGNTHRPVELSDARGFALVDDYASVILVNAKDTLNARKFTLMHELGHIVSGNEGISNVSIDDNIGQEDEVENWCNKFATEILVPEESFRKLYETINHNQAPFEGLEELSKYFKISTLVIMRRIYDLGYYKKGAGIFWQEFNDEKERVIKILEEIEAKKKGVPGGGNYYNLALTRASKKFVATLIASTLEGNTTYTEAMNLMNTKKIKTFNELATMTGNL